MTNDGQSWRGKRVSEMTDAEVRAMAGASPPPYLDDQQRAALARIVAPHLRRAVAGRVGEDVSGLSDSELLVLSSGEQLLDALYAVGALRIEVVRRGLQEGRTGE